MCSLSHRVNVISLIVVTCAWNVFLFVMAKPTALDDIIIYAIVWLDASIVRLIKLLKKFYRQWNSLPYFSLYVVLRSMRIRTVHSLLPSVGQLANPANRKLNWITTTFKVMEFLSLTAVKLLLLNKKNKKNSNVEIWMSFVFEWIVSFRNGFLLLRKIIFFRTISLTKIKEFLFLWETG